MANPPQRTQQVPQHVTALLSHLTSRPGVQSTLILSRKDGSIIQSTGQLAQENTSPRTTPPSSSTPDQTPPAQQSDSSPASPTSPTPTTYQPSQAEALAAHIFNFVSSASALGISLVRPITTQSATNGHSSGLDAEYGSYANGNVTNTPREEEQERLDDREEEDEIKLLRMRTRKHEIVVVPDRKYLLCVVHDAAHGGGGPGAAGARSSR